jgi:hypothetical protein
MATRPIVLQALDAVAHLPTGQRVAEMILDDLAGVLTVRTWPAIGNRGPVGGRGPDGNAADRPGSPRGERRREGVDFLGRAERVDHAAVVRIFSGFFQGGVGRWERVSPVTPAAGLDTAAPR